MTKPVDPGDNILLRIKRLLKRRIFANKRVNRNSILSNGGIWHHPSFLALVAFLCGVLLTGGLVLSYVSLRFVDKEDQHRADASRSRTEVLPSVRDVLDPSSLPYEEALGGSLEQVVKQADYALLRTLERLEVTRESLHLEDVEMRSHEGEEYHFQRLGIRLGKQQERFISGMITALATWAPEASLRQNKDGLYGIIINGTPTHELSLLPPLVADVGHAKKDDGLPSADKATGTVVRRPATVQTTTNAGRGRIPLLAIVIDDIGENMRAVQRLVALEYPVTLSIWPHASHARLAAETGWKKGREIMIHQPMEPLGYPEVNPGPGALFVNMTGEQIQSILTENLKLVPHAVGINNHMGSRFTQNKAGVKAVLGELSRTNLFVLDSVTHGNSVLFNETNSFGMPAYRRSVFLDVVRDKKSIVHQLEKAAHIAQREGTAIAIGHPTPETLSALEEWQRIRNREVRIVDVMSLSAAQTME